MKKRIQKRSRMDGAEDEVPKRGPEMKVKMTKKEDHSQISDGAEDIVGSELPYDVVASIQARLPLLSLLRSGLVCKAWSKAVASPWLLRERLEARGGARERMLRVVSLSESDMAWSVYDPASDRWYQLQLNQAWLRELLAQDGILEVSPGSMGGGLLLSSVYTQRAGQSVVVPHLGNPVARSWTSLPVLPGDLRIGHVLGVFVDAMARSFKLVALRETRMIWDWDRDIIVPTYAFDSTLGSWSVTTSALPTMEFFSQRSGEGVFVGKVLYCVAAAQVGLHDCNLLAYDLERASWSWLAVAPLPDLAMFNTKLINVQDRLLCAVMGWRYRNRPPCVHILELDFASMAWTAVDAMPASMGTRFWKDCFPPDNGMLRFTHSNRIKVVAGQDSEVYIMHHELNKIAAVDLRHKPAVWRWLPSYPYEQFERNSFQCLEPWLEFGWSK